MKNLKNVKNIILDKIENCKEGKRPAEMVAPYMDPKKGKENDKQGVAGSIGTMTETIPEVIGVEQSQGLGVAGSD